MVTAAHANSAAGSVRPARVWQRSCGDRISGRRAPGIATRRRDRVEGAVVPAFAGAAPARLDRWRHPVTRYSLSYARLLELEVRLLEKEWSGEPGLFARMRLR
jgi:hypothetical protein